MKFIKALFILLITGFSLYSQDVSNEIYNKCIKSVVSVGPERKPGSKEKQLQGGTGFFIDKDLFVTNYSIIRNAYNVKIYLHTEKLPFSVLGYVAIDSLNDLIILKTSYPYGKPMAMAGSNAKKDDKVYVLGCPLDMDASISDAVMLSSEVVNKKNLQQINVSLSKDNNGGPVVNANGEVIGVFAGQVNPQQKTNYMISVDVVKALISKKVAEEISIKTLQPQNKEEEKVTGKTEEKPVQDQTASQKETTVNTTVTETKPKEAVSDKAVWYTFEQAVELNKKQPKKIFIDVYTDWCGWCKKLDAVTFSNPVIGKYLNEHFYCVKLNAEGKDTIRFNGQVFVNPNPMAMRSNHQLAVSLLKGQMSYPSMIFLDESVNIITPVAGFLPPQDLEPIMKFIGEDEYKKQTYDQYKKTFVGEVKP